MKNVTVLLTSAIVIGGEIVPGGKKIETTEKNAKNLLNRGKAVLADPDISEDDQSKGEDNSLNDMTVKELKEIADDMGVELVKNAKKPDIIAAIEKAEAELSEDDQSKGE